MMHASSDESAPRPDDAVLRQRMDGLTLRLVRTGDAAAASGLRELCLGVAGAAAPAAAAQFWRTAAAFFDALVLAPPPLDAAAKRLAAQVLLAYAAQARDGSLPGADLLDRLQQACAPLAMAPDHAAAEALDRVRVVGDLPVEISAYNLFLNEADEGSRRLLVELSEWTIESDRAVFDSTIDAAGQLAEAAARIGFEGLALFAEALAQALRHVQPFPSLGADDAALFMAAADEVRRLLHQFAAGFLKAPRPELAQALQQRLLRLAPPEPEKAWAGLLTGLGSALRQCVARPDNPSARAEVMRLVQLVETLARQLGAAACSSAAQRMVVYAGQLDQDPAPASVLADLQRELPVLQAAGSAFFTTA